VDVHKNARLTRWGRGEVVRRVIEGGAAAGSVATSFGVSIKTVRKWVGRFQLEGAEGLADRSSRPHRLRRPTSAPLAETVLELRRRRITGRQISRDTGLSRSTVSRILRRARLSRARDLDPPPPVVRYERKTPGELIHLDIKKLGRFEAAGHRVTGDRRSHRKSARVGWEYVHVCIDDASRIAFTQIYPNEQGPTVTAFLHAAIRYYEGLGVQVSQVMTDNGGGYRSGAFAAACKTLGLKHIRTRPYTPRTNGKAERFIQTALREWAYAQLYPTSEQRAEALPAWTHRYNWHRPHGGINSAVPISRLCLSGNDLMRLHS
jgi:transposase InsO family protein